MIFKMKRKLSIIYDGLETKFYIKKLEKKKNKEKIIFLQSPEHGNLGDHLISMGIRELIKKKYSNNDIIEFSGIEYDKYKDKIKKIITPKDTIILVGGGNFGNLYMEEEVRRRCMVQMFPNNKIIIMPVTITYTSDKEGQKEQKISQEIYQNHRKLTIFCREEKSYKSAKKIFNKNKIILSPDSANALENFYIKKWDIERNGALFCLRNDKEKVRDNKNIEEIKKLLGKEEIHYEITDTVIRKRVTKKTRGKELETLVKNILSSEILITDRLHGMILGVITNTPTIVFKSLDHKITESYKWYEKYGYIYYVENKNDIEKVLKNTLSMKVKKEKYALKEKLEEKFFGE